MDSVSQLILDGLSRMCLSRRELAARSGIAAQSISSYIAGKRDIPIESSVVIDCILGYPKGTIAKAQLDERLSSVNIDMQDKRHLLISMVKNAGGFWSWQGLPENIDDDRLIEASLMFLELEDMHILDELWSRRRIKNVWKKSLVSQGKRMNILNFILATQYFHCRNSLKYLTCS